MKKRNLNALKLNKRNISSLKEMVKGGLGIPMDTGCTSVGNGNPCTESHDCKTGQEQ